VIHENINSNAMISLPPLHLGIVDFWFSALLGDVQALGEQLAAKRNASLAKAISRSTDGILFYTFEFAIKDGTHQMLQMCVGRGKLWSLDLNSSEKRWEKKKEMYKNVANSFMPKLG
jgi:photosystem II oxygen-evolving enhancer protein 2